MHFSTISRVPATAGLAGIEDDAAGNRSGGLVEVGIGKDDLRALAPNSSVIGLTPVRATFSMMAEPARVEPVKLTLAISAWPVSALPVVRPSPTTTLTRPAEYRL